MPSDGPPEKSPPPLRLGDASKGRDVFRFETFGNEGFWTDAVRMPQGLKQARATPLAALKIGHQIDSEMIAPSLRQVLATELKTDLSPRRAPRLNDPKTLERLIGSNAVIGIVVKNGKVGVSCALCHTITDGSMFSMPGKGSIGRRVDGPTPHGLNVGMILSLGANSKALFPTLQLDMGGGKTIGRAPKGLTKNSTEAQVDAYLRNPKFYPVGTFDDTPDGIGNPVHITPLFRQDLAALYGTSGQNAMLDNFSNTVYTVLFDQTMLVTPGGKKFLKALGGAGGEKLAKDYASVLQMTGVRGHPFVRTSTKGKPGAAMTPVGVRVNDQKLVDMNAYLARLPAPKGVVTDGATVARGRELFRTACTSCHNVDQSKPVPPVLVPMKRIWPGYMAQIIANRKPPLSPIQNSPGTFDDRMVVVDASPRGGIRGNALPLLLDLARKPVFLHDDSVPSLSSLLDPKRGATAPHPFYVPEWSARTDMIAFLKSLDTSR